MPAKARPHTRRLPSGKVQLLYLDRGFGAFPSKTAALDHFDEVVRPQLEGKTAARRDVTPRQLADTFLDRHGKITTDRTIRTLRGRLARPLKDFGDVVLCELEGMTDEIAAFAAEL